MSLLYINIATDIQYIVHIYTDLTVRLAVQQTDMTILSNSFGTGGTKTFGCIGNIDSLALRDSTSSPTMANCGPIKLIIYKIEYNSV